MVLTDQFTPLSIRKHTDEITPLIRNKVKAGDRLINRLPCGNCEKYRQPPPPDVRLTNMRCDTFGSNSLYRLLDRWWDDIGGIFDQSDPWRAQWDFGEVKEMNKALQWMLELGFAKAMLQAP